MKIDKGLSNTISWAQFICSIVIILDHSFDYLGYEEVTKNQFESVAFFISKMLSGGLAYSSMAIFFLLSSLLLYKNWNEKDDVGSWYAAKIKSRFVSLFIPYILWNTVWTVFYLGAGILDKSGLTNLSGNIKLIDIFSGILLGKYNEVFWYLKVLMFYVLISPVIGILIEKGKGVTVLYSFALSCTLFLSLHKVYFYNFYNFFFWCLGAYLAIYAERNGCISKFVHKKVKVFGNFIFHFISLSLLTWLLIFDYRATLYQHSVFMTNALALLLDVIGTICFWNLLNSFFKKRPAKWYTNCSFLIYAMHKPIQQAFNKITARLFSADLFGYTFNLLGGTVFSLCVILVFVCIMERFMPRVLLVLNGGRKIGGEK